MRRFHDAHEGVLPSSHVLSLWKCDEAASSATLGDSSYAGAFPLVKLGPGAVTADIGLFTSGREGEPESPLVPGATLHLDASNDDSFTFSSGTTISQWSDESGSGNHFDNNVGTWSAYPTRESAVQNGLQGVRFGNGGASALEQVSGKALIDVFDTSSFTMYLVLKPTDIVEGHASLSFLNDYVFGEPSENEFEFFLRNVGGGASYNAVAMVDDDTTGGDAVGTRNEITLASETDAFVAAIRYDGVALQMSINGGSEQSVACGPMQGAKMVNAMLFGRHSTSGRFYRGYVLEVVAYDTTHSTGQRDTMVSYLSDKWGI